jgi:hypothetical protein
VSKKTNTRTYSILLKAINYCDNNGKAIQTYNLGKIYDLNRYTDARESFTESTSLFQSLTPTVQSANTYYYLSLPIVEKKTKQLKFLNKSIAIYKELNINSQDDLINLQRVLSIKLTAITILHLTV